MDLTRDEETRVRNLGRLALEKAAKAGAAKAANGGGISRTFATVSRVNGDGTIDVSMGDYTDVNGVTSECILRGLRMTVACSGAQVGDRVIVDTYAHVSVVTGILANADNAHSVKLLSWSSGALYAQRIGNYCTCMINGSVNTPASWTEVVIGTLPEGYRPNHWCVAPFVVQNNGAACGIMNVSTSGNVLLQGKGYVGGYNTTDYVFASVSYPVQ